MKVTPRARQALALPVLAVLSMLIVAPASATPLDEESCQKLRTERQALTVLGIDKYVEKGAEWAKTQLTVADLNLVKRYFEVFEQLKFRCEKLIAAIEVDEKDDDEDEGEAAGAPPLPQRKGTSPASAPASPAAPAAKKPKSGSAGNPFNATNASTIQSGSAQAVPAR